MQTTNCSADDREVLWVIQVRRSAACIGEQAEAEMSVFMQAGTIVAFQRRNDRQIPFKQCVTESMLFQYGFITPASRAVKFCNHFFATGQTDGVNAIFIAVQCADTPVCLPSGVVDGIQYLMRIE